MARNAELPRLRLREEPESDPRFAVRPCRAPLSESMLPCRVRKNLARFRCRRAQNSRSHVRCAAEGKSTHGARGGHVGGNLFERAFGTGNDVVSAEVFQDFRELVQIATHNDIGFFISVAGTLGNQQGCFNVVRGDDDQVSMVDSGIGQGAFLFRVIHNDGFAGTNQVVNYHGIFLDQDVGQLALAKMLNETASQMAAANDDNVIFHFAREHAASLLRIVALQRLKNENGNDDSEQDALSPKRIEFGELSRMNAEIDRAKKGVAQKKMFPMAERNRSEREPGSQQDNAPATLPEEEGQPNPEEAAHAGLLPRTYRDSPA